MLVIVLSLQPEMSPEMTADLSLTISMPELRWLPGSGFPQPSIRDLKPQCLFERERALIDSIIIIAFLLLNL